MTPFWIIDAILWTLVFLYALPGVIRGNPISLAVASSALMMGGFCYRWLFAPDNELIWQSLYMLSAVNAVYLWRLAWAYGGNNGPRF